MVTDLTSITGLLAEIISVLTRQLICFCCVTTIQQKALFFEENAHSMKINKTERISSCIITEVSLVHLFQSLELQWRFPKQETAESCWAVSHTHTVICKGNLTLLTNLFPLSDRRHIAVTEYLFVICSVLKEKKTDMFCLISHYVLAD